MRLLNSSTGISMFPSGNNAPGYEFKPTHAAATFFTSFLSNQLDGIVPLHILKKHLKS
jgi:hypothetical protein